MSLREKYDTLWGKFDAPFTRYVYETVILNGFRDEFVGEDGEWAERVGKYVIAGDDRGFIWRCETSARTVEAAVARFNEIAAADFPGDDSEDT